MDLVTAFGTQARACGELGSPLYESLLNRIAADLERGGVSRGVLAGHEDDPGPSALALRVAGSVHRLVLEGDAPELAMFYPSAGGDWNPRSGWKAFGAVLRDQPERVRQRLDQAPQTNEIGRAGALMGGLLHIGESHRLPLRLFEMGCSGGLNLFPDHYFYVDETGAGQGREDSAVRLDGAWRGRRLTPWTDLQVHERVGGDIAPVDVNTADGRLTLMSYVWPDQLARLGRLRDAFEVASEVSAEVRRQDAVSFVRDITVADRTTTVLWHSVMWQYLSRADRDAVTDLVELIGSTATNSAPFAHLYLEPTRRTPEASHEFLVVRRLWPGGETRILGKAAPHGLPTTWE